MSYFRVLFVSLVSVLLVTSLNANAARVSSHDAVTPTVTEHTRIKASTQAININTADADELTTLKGVGAKKAQAIIDYRSQHGKFSSVDDLANVKGIGKKGLKRLLKNNPDRIEISNG